MTRLPPLDLHAHVDPNIASSELDELRAVDFAVTRSLDEATTAGARSDATVVWGVGCHPGVARSHGEFTADRFAELLAAAAFAGELGLDGKTRVPLDRQRNTLRAALTVLADVPRITSLHSAGATAALLDELQALPIHGIVLHWWLGDATLTQRALEAGCE